MQRSDSLSHIPLKIRRSNSLSQIPLRNRGSSSVSTSSNRDKKRSNSTGRSSKDTTYLLKPKRTSSPESQVFVKQTPLRQRSLLRTTPASLRSTSSNRVSPASGFIEKKTIQKLSTNKAWVAKQYDKVQKCILNTDLFDPSIVTVKNIKPPSIKIFVYMVTVLLTELMPVVKISMDNYMDEIPRILKAMKYPGTLTKSTLKTVNTIHTWPQVIGLLGWLVDKVTIVERATIDVSNLTKNEQHAQLGVDYILMRYDRFCNKQMDTDEINIQFSKYLAETLGVDTDSYFKIMEECDAMEAQKRTLQKKVDELEKLTKDLDLKHTKMIDELNEIQGTDADKEAAVEAELNYYPAQLQKLIQKENELMERVLKLEETIKVQSCTFQEKRKMLDGIKTLKSEKNIYLEKIQHVDRIKKEFDTKILEEREKLQSNVITWNRSLTLSCVRKPHLKQLLLPEKGFHREDFLKEILEVAEKKKTVEYETENAIKELHTEIMPLKNVINGLENELKQLQSDLKRAIETNKEVSDKIIELKNDKEERIKAWELKKEKLLFNIKDLQDDKDLKSLNEELQQLKEKREETKEELKRLQASGLRFFIEIRKIIREQTLAIARIVDRFNSKAQRALEAHLEAKIRFNQFLESLSKD